MKNFGFYLQKTRSYEIKPLRQSCPELVRMVPSFMQCMFCGGCSATCSANSHVNFNILRYNLLFRHGMQDEITNELDQCMLCGKCTLVCPRGVNIRAMVMEMRRQLQNRQP